MSTKFSLGNVNNAELVITNPDTNFNGRTIDISKVAHQVDTIADLRAMTEKPDTVYVTGYYTAGDGAFGSHFFKRVDSAGVDNTGTIIVPTGVTTYYYALQYEGAVNVKWFGAVGDGVTDDTVAIQRAINSNLWVYIPKSEYLITNMIQLQYNSVLRGQSKSNSIIKIDGTFNLSSVGVIKSTSQEPGFVIEEITIDFYQNTSETVRANLIQYPPAIWAQNTPRFRISNVRITKGLIGIDMRGNSGGAWLENIELGCLEENIYIDGSLDFVHIEGIHVWVFNFAGTPLMSIMQDGIATAAKIGRCDGLDMRGFSTFAVPIEFFDGNFTTNTGGAFGAITNLNLDGAGSRLLINAGELSVSGVYSTSNIDNDYAIKVENPSLSQRTVLTVSSGHFTYDNNITESSAIIVNAILGEVTISSCNFFCGGSQTRAIKLTDGKIMASDLFIESSVSSTVLDMIYVEGGRIALGNMQTNDASTSLTNVINILNDDFHLLNNLTIPNRPILLPSSIVHTQISNISSGRNDIQGNTLVAPIAKNLYTGTLDSNGDATIAHGLGQRNTIIGASAYYINGAIYPITIDYINGVNIKISNTSGANYNYRCVIEFYNN